MYDGFDYPTVTNCTASTSLPTLQSKENLLIFGGSNTCDMTSWIQPVLIDSNQ